MKRTAMRLSADDLAFILSGIEAVGMEEDSGLTPEGAALARRVFLAADRLGVSFPGYAWMRAACGMHGYACHIKGGGAE
jgi:hypothetical protein